MVSTLLNVNICYNTLRKVEDIVNQWLPFFDWLLFINCLLGAIHLFTMIGASHSLFSHPKLYKSFFSELNKIIFILSNEQIHFR